MAYPVLETETDEQCICLATAGGLSAPIRVTGALGLSPGGCEAVAAAQSQAFPVPGAEGFAAGQHLPPRAG